MSEPPRLAMEGEDLVSRARAGDRDAENALFERLHARILSLAKRRLWDAQAAEDITQETLRTVLEKYRGAEMPRGFFPWVFTILYNKVGNYLKRRRLEIERGVGEDASVTWETVGVSPDGVVAAIDLAESLEKAMRRVSPDCRKVFALLLADAGREEMRLAFGGEPTGTLDSRVSRCREKLLQHLEHMWKEKRP